MARRIKSRKSKHLGNRTFGGGNTKNRRGRGNRGGTGRAGFHKHKWLQTIVRGEHKNRKYGFHSHALKTVTITLEQLSQMEGAKLVLKTARIVATGAITAAKEVHAYAFSAKAKEKIEAAGGKAIALARPAVPKASVPAPARARKE